MQGFASGGQGGAQAWTADHLNLSAINVSRINKNFSPISILDNSQQLLSQMGGLMQSNLPSDPKSRALQGA